MSVAQGMVVVINIVTILLALMNAHVVLDLVYHLTDITVQVCLHLFVKYNNLPLS